jgi:hypothetical protein
MTYNTNVPQSTDRVSDTQAPILTNFQELNEIYGTDHYDYTTQTANEGFHAYVHLPDNTSSPPSAGAGVGAIYAKSTSGVTLPYWRRDGLATDFPIMQIGAMASITTTGAPGPQTKTGIINISSVNRAAFAGQYQVNFTNPFPDTKYAIFAQAFSATGRFFISIVQAINTGNCTLQFYEYTSGFSLKDPSNFYVICVQGF